MAGGFETLQPHEESKHGSSEFGAASVNQRTRSSKTSLPSWYLSKPRRRIGLMREHAGIQTRLQRPGKTLT
jgi:hypothetical protein